MIFDMLRQAGIAALVSLFMGLVPLGFGILYAARPTEQRLALMRPLSLAAIFAAIHGTALGLVNTFRYVGSHETTPVFGSVAFIGLAESLVTLFFDFGCLMLAWICVAIGQWRRP
jgi:hypothetical protein